MADYHDGRRVEYAVTHDLRDNGYHILRAASSKGYADVSAIKYHQLLLVSVKRTDPLLPPEERARLIEVALCLPYAVPLVAYKPFRQPLRYRRLTGQGPKDWVEWTPDEAAA